MFGLGLGLFFLVKHEHLVAWTIFKLVNFQVFQIVSGKDDLLTSFLGRSWLRFLD